MQQMIVRIHFNEMQFTAVIWMFRFKRIWPCHTYVFTLNVTSSLQTKKENVLNLLTFYLSVLSGYTVSSNSGITDNGSDIMLKLSCGFSESVQDFSRYFTIHVQCMHYKNVHALHSSTWYKTRAFLNKLWVLESHY